MLFCLYVFVCTYLQALPRENTCANHYQLTEPVQQHDMLLAVSSHSGSNKGENSNRPHKWKQQQRHEVTFKWILPCQVLQGPGFSHSMQDVRSSSRPQNATGWRQMLSHNIKAILSELYVSTMISSSQIQVTIRFRLDYNPKQTMMKTCLPMWDTLGYDLVCAWSIAQDHD